jgi:hypothetical protein
MRFISFATAIGFEITIIFFPPPDPSDVGGVAAESLVFCLYFRFCNFSNHYIFKDS